MLQPYHLFLNKFKEVYQIKQARVNVASHIAINSQSSHQGITISTNKHIFQFSMLSRVCSSIFSCKGQLILARLIKTDKLCSIRKKVIACLHIFPLLSQVFIPFDCNFIENLSSQTSFLENFVQLRY